MATNLKEVDVVIVGLGWTGGILAKELAEAGLKVVALERGAMRTTENDFAVPNIRDELRYVQRQDLMMDTARDTLTVRNNPSQEALPMRRLGSFLPGDGVGGSGVHWSGHTWRWTDMEFKVRSKYEERYGKNFIPADMTIQDWGITYDEIEPYYDRFERTAAVSGKAGNLRGQIQPGGNFFEAPRSAEYPLPPLTTILASELFAEAAQQEWLPSVPAAVCECVTRLHQSRRIEIRCLPILRVLRAFRLRSQRQGKRPHHGDSDRDAQSEFRAAHQFLGHQGDESLGRQARHRRGLYQRAERRGIRTTGRPGAAVRLRDQQRTPDAALRHRRAL